MRAVMVVPTSGWPAGDLTSAWLMKYACAQMWWSRSDGQSGGTPPVTPAKAIVSPLTTAITTHAWNGNFVRAPPPPPQGRADAVYASEQGRATGGSMRTHPGGLLLKPSAVRPVGHLVGGCCVGYATCDAWQKQKLGD